MSRKGEVAVAVLAAIATAGVMTAAVSAGDLGPFADVFGLGVLWTIIRKVNAIEVIVAKQPSREELADVTTALGRLKDGVSDIMDRAINRASGVVADSQSRLLEAMDGESHRRHQLRDEYEEHRDLVNERLNQHGEKIAILGAKMDAWPSRKQR